MLELKCRLCSSDHALISLYGGKCRKNRDYIRKLVESTTGIKFEKNDTYKYICYPCTVQSYNFYVFKARSLENEDILEAQIKKNEKTKSSKIEILDLGDIVLPEINELQDALAPWLISKSKYCDPLNSESGEDVNGERNSELIRNTDNVCTTVENETRNVPGIDISIQCHLPKNALHNSTQTDLPNTTCDKYVQYRVPNIAMHTQTNNVSTKSSKIQCCLLKDGWQNHNYSNNDLVQLGLKGVDKATQHCDTFVNCREMDCKCYLHNLVNIKQESRLSTTPRSVSPINNLFTNPFKNNIPPIPSASTPNTSLLADTDISEKVILCKMCNKILFSKESYTVHKKNHMACSFCKKKFSSMKRTKYHIDNDCEIKKKIDMPTVVQLVRVDNVKDIQKTYSKCLEDMKNFGRREKSKTQSTIRMRSRSTSSADSFHTCCNLCTDYPVTILHGLKLGIDKAVQTNLFDNQIVSTLVNGDITLKSKVKNMEDLMSPAKKIKLSKSNQRSS
ncbi:uncharacterized protein LOC108911783 [Anoplophora glabripennis]|uniref:uncharacterized protein LOC108911783 n=1 Tax=Anoplophora glabripennis TaxID=217634 RepID=UPI00087405F8|nr:uncharacterized protein LOC108911783 [Anoplophora glabripennis]